MSIAQALQTLFAGVSSNWPFDEKHYRQLHGVSPKEARAFAITHMHRHVTKEAGWIARILERQDHRATPTISRKDLTRVRLLAMKIIVTGVRLFLETGGGPDELEKYILKEK